MGLKKDFEEIEKLRNNIITKVKNIISTFPENDEIKNLTKLSGGGYMYTINFSQMIGNVWTPSYYVFEHQYKAVLNELEHANSNNIVSKLEKIISDGYIRILNQKIVLHPKVISNLKTLL